MGILGKGFGAIKELGGCQDGHHPFLYSRFKATLGESVLIERHQRRHVLVGNRATECLARQVGENLLRAAEFFVIVSRVTGKDFVPARDVRHRGHIQRAIGFQTVNNWNVVKGFARAEMINNPI